MIGMAAQSHGRAKEPQAMVLILIITLFALAGIALSVRSLARSMARSGSEYNFDSAPFSGLFADEASGEEPVEEAPPEIREGLLERARRGDLEALTEAHATGDKGLYGEALAALVARDGGCQERLEALVCHVVQNGELRASAALADLMIENWEKSPHRNAAIEMLHVSALSDDPRTFQRAMDTAFSVWSADRLDMSADELLSLIANEYWVLSSEARRSGESFLLKRRMSEIRRRLARRGSPATEEGENHEQQ
jgi:hypothetical protein